MENSILSSAYNPKGDFWGYLPRNQIDLKKFFEKLSAEFGLPEKTDELVIFFKEQTGDVRLRITNNSMRFIRKHKKSELRDSLKNDEYNATISLADAEQFIRILSKIGYSEGLFSFGSKLIYSNDFCVFTIRFNSEFGDFYQVKRHRDSDVNAGLDTNLTSLIQNLNLNPFTEEQYKSYIEDIWTGKRSEKLINENNSLNEKIKNLLIKHEYSNSKVKFMHDESIFEILKRRSNDYTEVENYFTKMTGEELVSTHPINYSNSFNISASIIIPTYNNVPLLVNTLKSIQNQNLTRNQFKSLEVIIVDDGSSGLENEFVIQSSKKALTEIGIDVLYIRLSSNKGRSFARNIGVKASKNSVLVFIDSDIYLEQNYIKEILVRHQYLDRIALVGFKENVNLSEMDKFRNEKPNTLNDFRMSVIPKSGWIGLYNVKEEVEVKCVEKTNNFKTFGNGFVLVPYDLPCMVVSHNLSVKRKHFEEIGGFEEKFGQKWGFEDTFLGACLIANNIYIIPLLSTAVYHMETESERATTLRSEKIAELQENYNVYYSLIHQKGYLYVNENL